MACSEMYNNNSNNNNATTSSQPQPLPPPMSPRISFSNDFVESHNSKHLLSGAHTRSHPPSSDFEFTGVSNHNMLPADELFCKGRLLPFKPNNAGMIQRTLRDELLVDDEMDLSLKPPKGLNSTNRWKGFLGLRKSHIGSRKSEKVVVGSSFDNAKRFSCPLDDSILSKSPQEIMSNEGQSTSSDMEMGI